MVARAALVAPAHASGPSAQRRGRRAAALTGGAPARAVLTATTIVSGSLAERAQFEAYVAYTPLMAVVIYPLVVHWALNGWLTTFAPSCLYLDFAGGSTVHLLGAAPGPLGSGGRILG
jgi:hypothetical protein